MTIPTGPEKIAHVQGRHAARNGKQKSDNPYRVWLTPNSIAYANAWDAGFDSIDKQPPDAAQEKP